MSKEIDLENRDPADVNTHVGVAYEDILAEPDGIHSPECVWKCSYSCFNGCKNFCYFLMTLFCGVPLAMCWGCEFAYIAFVHIWCLTPVMKCYVINCSVLQKIYGTCIMCYLQPIYEAYSYCFSNIRITKVNG